MKKLILFDVDGVLFDSKKNMENSWNQVMKKYSINKNFNEYKKFIGLPFNVILKKLDIKREKHEKIRKYYQANSIKYLNNIKPYPGVLKTIKLLKKKNYYLGIFTSKDKKRVLTVLKKHGLKFSIILTPQEGIRGKPYPDQILKCLKLLKLPKKKAIFVGDMDCDRIAATKAKINFIFATYGFGKIKKRKLLRLNKFEKIIKMVNKI